MLRFANEIFCPPLAIRLQLVAPIAIRACTLVLCYQLFTFTQFKGAKIVEVSSRGSGEYNLATLHLCVQSRRSVILSMALMLGFPLLIMALCTSNSYVGALQ